MWFISSLVFGLILSSVAIIGGLAIGMGVARGEVALTPSFPLVSVLYSFLQVMGKSRSGDAQEALSDDPSIIQM